MNKWVFFLSVIVLFLMIVPKKDLGKHPIDEQAMIPDESIRLRILANSNQEKDQQIKYDIRDRVNAEITTWMDQMSDIDDARSLIQQRLDRIEEIAKEVLQEHQLSYDIDITYDERVVFPRKMYGSYIYPEGEYEAILMTLGAGLGDNWWCVLFPPLCFLDFSSGTSVAESEESPSKEEEDVTIKFFLFEWFEQWFNWL